MRLAVNIDHIATIRNARGGRFPIRLKPRVFVKRPEPPALSATCVKTAGI